MTAKLWIYYVPSSGEGGVVRLKLKPGQKVEFYRFSRHEEGWSSQYNSYQFVGDGVISETVCDGKDCDGRQSHSVTHFCRMDRLDTVFTNDWDGTTAIRPKWEEINSEAYDEYAELSNY